MLQNFLENTFTAQKQVSQVIDPAWKCKTRIKQNHSSNNNKTRENPIYSNHNSNTLSENNGKKKSLNDTVPLEKLEYGVYGDLLVIYPKPYSIYLRGTLDPKPNVVPANVPPLVPLLCQALISVISAC